MDAWGLPGLSSSSWQTNIRKNIFHSPHPSVPHIYLHSIHVFLFLHYSFMSVHLLFCHLSYTAARFLQRKRLLGKEIQCKQGRQNLTALCQSNPRWETHQPFQTVITQKQHSLESSDHIYFFQIIFFLAPVSNIESFYGTAFDEIWNTLTCTLGIINSLVARHYLIGGCEVRGWGC